MKKQTTRMAGVPRLPLRVWKLIADALITGKDVDRTDRQKGKKSKVVLCREMCAGDKEFRKQVKKLAAELRAEDAKAEMGKRGWNLSGRVGFTPLFPGDRPSMSWVDRYIACLGEPNEAELLKRLEELYPGGSDPLILGI